MVCRNPRSPSPTQSISGKHEDPQPNPSLLRITISDSKFKDKCLKMCEADYGMTHSYLYLKRLERQIKGLENVKDAIAMVKRDRPKIKFECPECLTGEEWLKQLTQYRLTHYKLLISFWEAVKANDLSKISVVVKCMGSNAGKIDEVASELVSQGAMTEMDYKNVLDDTGDDYRTFDTISKDTERFHQFRECVCHDKPPRSRIETFIEDVHRPVKDVCEIIANDTQMRLELNIDF